MAIDVDVVNTSVEGGAWTEELMGCKFCVVSLSSTKFQRLLNRLNMPFRRKLDKGTMDPKDSKRILCKAMAGGLVVDWKGVQQGGKDVDFNKELAEKLLANNDVVREYVQEFASDLDNYYEEEEAEIVKS